MSLKLFFITLPYWIIFTIDFIYDIHLTYARAGTVIKILLPFCLIINIIGALYGKKELGRNKDQKIKAVTAIVLNLMPLLGIGSVIFWWLFIFKM